MFPGSHTFQAVIVHYHEGAGGRVDARVPATLQLLTHDRLRACPEAVTLVEAAYGFPRVVVHAVLEYVTRAALRTVTVELGAACKSLACV